MIDFLNRLFGRQSSGATAKERLRLVLMSDHLSLAPDMVDAMKRDFIDVISRYVDVDRDKIDVHFEHQDSALAMLANIPITGVNRNGTSNGTAPNGTAPNGTAAIEPPAANGTAVEPSAANGTAAMEPPAANGTAAIEAPAVCHGELVEPRPSPVEARAPRRKRRRKNAPNSSTPGGSPSTALGSG